MNATMILRMAGIYNLVYGLLLAFWPVQAFHSLAMPQTPSIMIQAIGMMVGVYGVAYWIACSDPVRYRPMVAVGLVGRTLGPIGFAAGLLQGVFVWKSATMFVFNDIIWWWPLGKIILNAWRNETRIEANPVAEMRALAPTPNSFDGRIFCLDRIRLVDSYLAFVF